MDMWKKTEHASPAVLDSAVHPNSHPCPPQWFSSTPNGDALPLQCVFQPNFEMLYNHVKQLLSNELLLTQMEKCALMEALVLISNQFKDYERQKAFLEELMAPVAGLWLSAEMQRYGRCAQL